MFISPSFFYLAGFVFKTICQLSQNHSLNYDHKTVVFVISPCHLKTIYALRQGRYFFACLPIFGFVFILARCFVFFRPFVFPNALQMFCLSRLFWKMQFSLWE